VANEVDNSGLVDWVIVVDVVGTDEIGDAFDSALDHEVVDSSVRDCREDRVLVDGGDVTLDTRTLVSVHVTIGT
jgi:hypothetical protein